MRPLVPVWILAAGLGVLLLPVTVVGQATERVLYVSAIDGKSGEAVSGLGPTDFRVTEDGAAREVLRVTPATTPMPVAIIADNQAAAQATIADLRTALTSFIDQIDGLGPVAIITSADRPTILQDYTPDVKMLRAAANRIFAQPDSGATLLDAMVEVSRGLGKRESDRAAIVLVTTELTEFSTLHYSQVLDALKDSGAMLSAVVLQNQAGSMQDDPARNRAVVLDRGIRDSGGWREDVFASMTYSAALTKIAIALKNQYRVVYARPQTLIPPERVAISSARAGVMVNGVPARGQKER